MNTARMSPSPTVPITLIALIAIFMLASPAAATEPTSGLGRLFMTPAWRTHLERQRQLNLQETRTLEGGAMRLDGIVVRSSGATTVWVNRQPQTGTTLDTGVTVSSAREQPERATLVTGTEPPAKLKVGETLNRATRETIDGLAGGEIRVHRPPDAQ